MRAPKRKEDIIRYNGGGGGSGGGGSKYWVHMVKKVAYNKDAEKNQVFNVSNNL